MSCHWAPNIITDNLVLYLDAANKKSYPGSGSTWFDLSLFKNNGTNYLTTWNAANNAFTYSSTNGYKTEIPSVDSINFSNPEFTVSVWVKLTTNPLTTGTYNIVSKKDRYNNTQKGWMVNFDFRAAGVLQLRLGDGVALNDGTPMPSINTWQYMYQTTHYNNVTIVNNTNYVIFYINGQLVQNVAHGAYTTLDNTSTLNIGDTPNGLDSTTNMNVGIVKLYNRKLTPDEILQNFNALRRRFER